MDRLIEELAKVRDVCKRRAILKRKGLSKEQIEDILARVHFQVKGRLKFPRAHLMRFSREGLAQASSKYVAEYRTWKMRSTLGKIGRSLDICCGIGGDTIAMATRWKVVAVEKDKDILEMARHNVNVYDLSEKVDFVQGDCVKLLDDKKFIDKVKDVDCIFFDPSRRCGEERTVKTEEYEPPLSFVEKLRTISPNICVKISPGTDQSRIEHDCDVEVVSYKGEVKEIMLWFGDFKGTSYWNRTLATKLPEMITLIKEEDGPDIPRSAPRRFLYEPDPAFIKAHMIQDLAKEFGLSLVHSKIAYLTGDEMVETPLLKMYLIKRVLDLDYGEINKTLSELGIGKVDFKARGVSIDLRNIHRKVRGKGRNKGLVIFTKIDARNQAIICMYR